MNANAPSALAAIPPPVTADRKTITERRVRTAADVVAAYSVMRTADLMRARDRALCQSAVDGAAPYSDSRSRAQGTYGRSNINPGIAQRSTFKEEAPYNEILEAIDIFTTVPTLYGDADSRAVWEPIMAEGFTKMLRNWGPWNYTWQYNVSLFVREGISFATHDDENDWRPSIFGLQEFKVPNESKPSEEALDMCGWRSKMNCRDLYNKVQNERVAEKLGWNVKAVKDAIKQACASNNTSYDYEQWEKRWKANDVLDGARAPQVDVINLLVREVDGTVTHLVSPKTPENDEAPLFYEGRKKYRKMSHFMTMFPYGVGTNGDLHSIRGHTSRIFPTAQGATRTVNAFIDLAMFAATPHLECANDDAMTSIPFRKAGYLTLVQQGNKFMDVKVPNFEENLIPLYGVLTQLFEGQSSGASLTPGAMRGMERKTNKQEDNDSMKEGQLTTSAMSLFFPALGRMLKNIMRRVARKNYRQDEPGGEEVWWLRNYLVREGVPLEALYRVDIDSMEVNTGFGKGSQAARMAVADSIMQDYYRYDDKGQNEAIRLKIQTRAGASIANRIVPPIPGLRPGQQVDNADDQNGCLVSRNRAQILSVKVRPDQNSAAHVRTHLEFLQELWPMTQMQDQREALDTIQPLWTHAIDDLQTVDKDNPLFKQAKQALREMSEWVVNTAKELAAEEDRQMEQAGGGQGTGEGKDVGGQGPNMSNLIRSADARAKLQFTMAKNADDLEHRREMQALDRAGKVQNMLLKQAEQRMKFLMMKDKPAKSKTTKAAA